MTSVNNTKINEIIRGSTVLGTGGGGRYDSAIEAVKTIPSIELISYDELRDGDTIITVYGAGGLTKAANTESVIQQGLETLETRLGKPIKAVVPVEIGPFSLAMAFDLAVKLKLPVVDGDLVGFRSVPEIFIELVTLVDLPRTPLVFGNNAGDLLVLEKEASAESLERTIRAFSDQSESNTFVLGYPYTKEQLGKCLAKGSVSYCINIQQKLDEEFRLVDSGVVSTNSKKETGGFTQGSLKIKAASGTVYEAIFKNEYLVLLKDGATLVTCPDFICLVDEATGLGLNNGDSNVNKKVKIYAKAAIKEWRTKQGLALFSPCKLGLNYQQKIVERS